VVEEEGGGNWSASSVHWDPHDVCNRGAEEEDGCDA
jgi:hypothetical protein